MTVLDKTVTLPNKSGSLFLHLLERPILDRCTGFSINSF